MAKKRCVNLRGKAKLACQKRIVQNGWEFLPVGRGVYVKYRNAKTGQHYKGKSFSYYKDKSGRLSTK